jgi:hypothetical protein
MASGHVNRIYRPNTWLHRPMLQNVKKALANSEPSTHGTSRTWRDVGLESVMRSRTDVSQRGPPDQIQRKTPQRSAEHHPGLKLQRL